MIAMTLDVTKVLIYVLVLGALAAGGWFLLSFPSDEVDDAPLVEAPGPVVVPPIATAPVLSPPCNCPEPPPAVVVVVPEKPVTKAKAPPTKAKPKAVVVKQGCGKVPVEAYQYPKDVVLAAAERRGVKGADMATLRRCIGA